MKTNLLPVTISLLSMLNALHAQTVPNQINYQGVFADPTGTNLADGNYNISFSIFTNATAGTAVWGPYIAQVPLIGGRCNVVLGPVDVNGGNIVPALNGASRFLEVSIGTTNIVPRQ